jgi:NAD(P)-dependent dehydrogenase (short-subunit alcohol dehydrogenase family)
VSGQPVALVTGTTHGIGTVTSFGLARAGYTVVMLCRNIPAASALAQHIRAQIPGSAVQVVHCDLASLASVRAASREVRERHPRIDRLINNAGIVSTRHRFSVDGHELTFATNHLGPFLLTRLLLPAVAPGGRIINVSSRVHYRGRLDLDSVDNPRSRYSSIAAYARSKLANVLDSFALARRLAGSGITANCLHPGVVATHLLPSWLNLIRPLFKRSILTPEQGARTTLYLALD